MAIRINRKPAGDIPVYSFTDFDNVQLVKQAMRELEYGYMNAASQVVDQMGRDDRLSGLLSTRANGVLSKKMSFETVSGDALEDEEMETALKAQFAFMFPKPALVDLLKWGTMLGVGLGQLVWDTTKPVWTFTLKVWHPKFVWWNWSNDERCFYVATQEGQTRVDPGNGEWVLYTPYGMQRGWMGGLVRPLYVPWLIRQWCMRDWARYSEVHGMPIRKATTPQGAQDEDKERFLQEVTMIGQETVVRMPQTPDGKGYALDLLEAMGNSHEGFDMLLTRAESAMAVCLLGQTLTTDAGDKGTQALGTVHDTVRVDIAMGDEDNFTECIAVQALLPWSNFNFAVTEVGDAPRPRYAVKPEENVQAKGTALKAMGDGISSLRKAGVQVDADKLTQDHKIHTTGPWQEPAPEPAPVAPGEHGHGAPEAPKANPKAKGKGKTKKTDGKGKALSAAALPSGATEGQLYADELVDRERVAASATLRKDVDEVLQLLERCSTFDEVKAGLVALYPKLDRSAMADRVRKTLLLAELAGMHSLIVDTQE